MYLISPMNVTEAELTASNVLENDYSVWLIATTYASGDRVIYNHKVYQSIIGANIGNQPDISASSWVYVSETNRYKMFDIYNSSKTVNASSIDVTITPSASVGVVNGLAFLNIACETIQVIVEDAYNGVVYNKTYTLIDYTNITNIYDYFFAPIKSKDNLVVIDLPSYVNVPIRVVLSGAGSVSCGVMLLGNLENIGCTLYGASTSITDYSKKEADEFGGYTIVERAFSKRGNFNLMVKTPKIDYISNLFALRRAKPTLYIGSELYQSTIIYGFFRDYTINISYPTVSEISIEIEGLT